MPDKPDTWMNLWLMLPDPAKAVVLSSALAIVGSFRRNGKTINEKIVSVLTGAIIVYTASLGIEASQMSAGWMYAVAGAIGTLGAEWATKMLHKWTDKQVS